MQASHVHRDEAAPSPDQVAEYADKMLGGVLVTKQTGPNGKPVNTLLVAKKLKFVSEKYLGIM